MYAEQSPHPDFLHQHSPEFYREDRIPLPQEPQAIAPFFSRFINNQIIGYPVKESPHVADLLPLYHLIPCAKKCFLHEFLGALAGKHTEVAMAKNSIRVGIICFDEKLFPLLRRSLR